MYSVNTTTGNMYLQLTGSQSSSDSIKVSPSRHDVLVDGSSTCDVLANGTSVVERGDGCCGIAESAVDPGAGALAIICNVQQLNCKAHSIIRMTR